MRPPGLHSQSTWELVLPTHELALALGSGPTHHQANISSEMPDSLASHSRIQPYLTSGQHQLWDMLAPVSGTGPSHQKVNAKFGDTSPTSTHPRIQLCYWRACISPKTYWGSPASSRARPYIRQGLTIKQTGSQPCPTRPPPVISPPQKGESLDHVAWWPEGSALLGHIRHLLKRPLLQGQETNPA